MSSSGDVLPRKVASKITLVDAMSLVGPWKYIRLLKCGNGNLLKKLTVACQKVFLSRYSLAKHTSAWFLVWLSAYFMGIGVQHVHSPMRHLLRAL